MEQVCRRAINFDLICDALKEFYPNKKSSQHAYDDIERFMLAHGFEHRQGSGYLSIQELSDQEVYRFVEKLSEEFTWLSECIGIFDVTNVGNIYDLREVIKNPQNHRNIPLDAFKEKKETSLKSPLQASLLNAQRQADSYNTSLPEKAKTPKKTKTR